MGRKDNPSRRGQSPEPEDNNQANLPPWLREDASATLPSPPPAPPPPSAEDENLPPWLREEQKREMLKGETLSEDWLSSADKLVESVDTELTYDQWHAMQKESARPKSIEEEVPDLLTDIPSDPAAQGTGPLGSTGELPDWFLGLEELDTSDAPDWLVGAPEPVAEVKPEEPPSWINDVADAQEEAPVQAGDSVNDFFSSLNRSSTLPSGESMDDLFGEFAMSTPEVEEEDEEEELPALDWVTGQSDVSAADQNYGAAEMETFFNNLSQSAQSSEAAREDDQGPTLDWMTVAEEPEEEPPTQLETYLSSLSAAEDVDIDEPELDLFTRQQTAAYPLPQIDIEPDEEPVVQDPGAYTDETMSWLNELQGIVSAVTREEEEEVAVAPDDFFSSPEEKEAFEESVAGRGDEFDWPEPAPYEEPEPEESDWLSQLNVATGTSEMESVQLDEPDDRPAPKLTGMLNRMRRAEEPPEEQEPSALFSELPDREMPPSSEDDLESFFMTEDLLSEADNPSQAPSNADAGFGSFPAEQESAVESQWGASSEPEQSESLDDLAFDLDALMSETGSQVTDDQGEVNFNLDDVLASLPTDSQGEDEPQWGASPEEAQPEEDESFNFDDLLGGISSGSQGDSSWGAEPEQDNYSPEDALTAGEPALHPADWGDAEDETESQETESEWEQPQTAETFDLDALTDEPSETYEPQWGVTEEETEQQPSETEEDEAYDLHPLTAEAVETYEPQWGVTEEETEQQPSETEEDEAYDLHPLTAEAVETYEPEWGAALDAETLDTEYSAEDSLYLDAETIEEESEPQWGAAEIAELAQDEQVAVEERDQPVTAQRRAEGTGELDDMSWLTDDIFAETRGLKPLPQESPKTVNAEWTGDAVFAQAAVADDEQPDAILASASDEFTASWDTDGDEAQAGTLESNEDFLASLATEMLSEEVEAAAVDEDFTASWETDGDEIQAGTLESNEDFLASLQAEMPSDEIEAAVEDELTPAWETDGDEAQAGTLVTTDDFLATLQALESPDDFVGTQQAGTSAEPRKAGFDDDFLNSLDTLDQMQAGGQSLVGDDLFSSWDDQQATPIDTAPPASMNDVEEKIEVADDFLNSLEFDASLDTGEAEAEPEGSEDFLASMQPDEQPQESEQPEFGEDFFGAPEMENESEAAESSGFGEDFFAVLETEDQPEEAEPSEQPQFDEAFFSALQAEDQPEEAEPSEQPQFDEAFFAALETPAQPLVPQPAAQPQFDEEFFAALEAQEQPENEELPPGSEFLTSPAAELQDDNEDFFRQMGMAESAETDEQVQLDWLAEAAPEEQAAPSEEDIYRTFEKTIPAKDTDPDWLTSLTEPAADSREAQPASGIEEGGSPDQDMWLVAFDSTTKSVDPFVSEGPVVTGPIEDLDSYLASLRAEEAPLSANTQAMLSQQDVDFDTLLDQPLMDEEGDQSPAPPFGSSVEPSVAPDWLTDVHASVGEVSAGAIVRQRKDRPEGELDDRLKKLRKRAKKLPTSASADKAADPLADVLPEMEESLIASPIRTGKPSGIGTVALTSNQQGRVALLKSLVTTEAAPALPKRLSAIDMTYDSPYMPGLEDEETGIVRPEKLRRDQAAPAKSARRVGRARRIRVDRLVITLLLAAGVLGPFLLSQLRIGNLPPSRFVAGSAQADAFQWLDGLPAGSLVMFAIEYSPASAAELDTMTDALLRHVLMQNAYPVVISGNPLALLRAGNLFTAINDDDAFRARIGAERPLQANADYFLIRYVPGSIIGLRAFSADTAGLMLTDIRGHATGLNVRSLSDFPVIVVVADRAEDVRGYAEQIAPLTNATVIAAVSYSAAPLVEPYVNAEVLGGPPALRGMLVGYGDAYTYNTLIGNVQAVERGTERPEPLLTTPGTGESLDAPPPAAQGTAIVVATQAINVRPEPNTNNSPIAQLEPGEVVEVIGFSDDGDWVNIRLPDGTLGWVSSQLVLVEIPEAALPKAETTAKMHRIFQRMAITVGAQRAAPLQATLLYPYLTNTLYKPSGVEIGDKSFNKSAIAPVLQQEEETEEPTATSRPTGTPRATAATEGAASITFTLPPHSPDYRDERWYAMTLGIIVSATVISLGAIMNIIRSILRRRR